MTMDPNEKKIDESWKEQVEKERTMIRSDEPKAPSRPEPVSAERPPEKPPQPSPSSSPRARVSSAGGGRELPAADFNMFLSSLSMQAMMALGEAPHPVTGAAQEDFEQARYLIDILGMLQEKTQGNLTPEESSLLEGLLYELRMKYVEKNP